MNIAELNSKWLNIEEYKNNFKALRISRDCIPELYLGIDKAGKRCLLLFLPSPLVATLRKVQKENLTIEYLKEDQTLIIRLNDFYFKDLFNELILSLYLRIAKISDPLEFTTELISSFYKWLEFFDEKHGFKLSKEEVKGLIGELFFLKNLIEKTSPSNINIILEAWKGPYDTSNDFVFDSKNIEIKTKEESMNLIKISSEYQLDIDHGKTLDLIIVDLKLDFIDGKSLYDWLQNVLNLIRSNFGEISVFLRAIKQKGLTMENSKEYNNYRYTIIRSRSYDCVSNEFPKLIRSNIPEQLSHVNYKIKVDAIQEFLTEENKY